MNLKKYIRKIKFWITLCQYYFIGLFVIRSSKYFYNIALARFFVLWFFLGIADFFNLYPFDEPFILSSDETNSLNNDYNTIEMSEKNLKNQEEIKSAKKNLSVWFVVTTVLWCVVLYVADVYS
jgi:hypothetical protein